MRCPQILLFLALIHAVACSSAPESNERVAEAHDADAGFATDVSREIDAGGTPADAGEPLEVYDPAPTVTTANGDVVGKLKGEVYAFKGIPFARPPIAELRWAPPVAPDSWTEPLQASGFGQRCVQPNLIFSGTTGQEDCLYLNVWTPAEASAEPRAVMLWFHGGSFTQGATSDKQYHGHDLAAEDVIVVTASYRLGALGYLAHPALAEAYPQGGSGNFGMLDQQMALRWVRDNIEAFGGNPENVTLFGESAGAISTCMHLFAPDSHGLFHKAILESGPCIGLMPTPDTAEAEQYGVALQTELGCDGDDPIACMRSADPLEVNAALGYRPGVVFGDGPPWGPVRDDLVVPADFDVELGDGSLDVDMLIGANADEGALVLVGANQGIVTVDYQAELEQMFGDDATRVAQTYPLSDYEDGTMALANVIDDRFVCGTREVARLRAEAGTAVYQYHFTYEFVTLLGALGAMHGAELAFVFGTELALTKLEGDEVLLSEAMQRYWTRFARTGDPNGDGDPTWPRYDAESDEHLVFDLDITAGAKLRAEKCDFWAEVGR
jgi:para-nitrobenzyl esterase